MGGLFGLLFVFLIPPLQAPDEQAHLYRSYQTSDLDFFADSTMLKGQERYGYAVPRSVVHAVDTLSSPIAGKPLATFDTSLYVSSLKKPLNRHDTQMVLNDAGNMYSPVVYIPQAIGVGAAKLANLPAIVMIWMGRLTNLAFWLMAIFFAIRLFPFAKWGLVVLALNPVTLTLAASLSADAVNISLAFLFISYVLYLRKDDPLLSRRQLLMLLALSVVIALTKPTNATLLLLLFLVPVKRFADIRKYLVWIGAILAISVAAWVVWSAATSDIVAKAVQAQKPNMGVDPEVQKAGIVDNPLGYMEMIIRNYVLVVPQAPGDAVLDTYFGVFGWLDVHLPYWGQITYICCLVLGTLYQFGRGILLLWRDKLLLLLAFGGAFIGSVTAMYMNYTPVGAAIVEGVQGRYFMPTALALLPIITGKRKIMINMDRTIPYVLCFGLLVVLLLTAAKLYARYY